MRGRNLNIRYFRWKFSQIKLQDSKLFYSFLKIEKYLKKTFVSIAVNCWTADDLRFSLIAKFWRTQVPLGLKNLSLAQGLNDESPFGGSEGCFNIYTLLLVDNKRWDLDQTTLSGASTSSACSWFNLNTYEATTHLHKFEGMNFTSR